MAVSPHLAGQATLDEAIVATKVQHGQPQGGACAA
jgi:hypothetical protein